MYITPLAMKGMDILGNIALVKFSREETIAKKRKQALQILSTNKNVRTVLEKTMKIKGRLRTPKTKFIAGINTKECSYKENGCVFRFNLETCYFSPRLSNERLEIAKMVKRGEEVLVLFAGVAPFSILIAKMGKAKKVVSIELGRKCSKYAQENTIRNKVPEIVQIVQGDARKKLPKMKEKFDRIVMARPNLRDSFLDVAFPRIKRGGAIHYYGFYAGAEENKLIELIKKEADKAKKKIKIIKIKKAGNIGVRKYRYRVDFKVLN